jgi:nodulation protein E
LGGGAIVTGAGGGATVVVVITGAGTVNALGLNVPQTLAAMREGRCGIGPLEFRDVERLSVRIGGQVRDWNAEAHFNRQQIVLYDRFTQVTLHAAREAVAQSGLDFRGRLGRPPGMKTTAASTKRAGTASIPSSCRS